MVYDSLFLSSRRIYIPDLTENYNLRDRSHKQVGKTNQQLRAPFAVLVQNIHNVNNFPAEPQVKNAKDGNSPHRKSFLFPVSDSTDKTWEAH